jgi:hypothetical protein
MSEKFEVSFNSPQCGWMSIGFKNGENEFHSTTAYAPYKGVLSEILQTLTALVTENSFEKLIKWNRLPEEFDFVFKRHQNLATIEIYQYPTDERLEKELVFTYTGNPVKIALSFYETFTQLYEDRETDEFEANWKQPFPFADFEKFSKLINSTTV